MNFQGLLKDYGWIFILTVGMMALTFLWLRLLSALRKRSEEELRILYLRDVNLYLERLENNKLLRIVFRKSTLWILRLEGYMKIGDEAKIRELISQLDKMKLPPGDALEFYQQRLSYFVSVGDREEAVSSRDMMAALFHKTKADQEERYQKVLKDADDIIGVYLDRDVNLLPELVKEAGATADATARGIIQYRIAILYHFAGDTEKTQIYLKRSAKNLKNTVYSSRIAEALSDETALERQ